MYYLTVMKNGKDIVVREVFDDFSSAIAHTTSFYSVLAARSVLKFDVEVINGQFARAYAELLRPEQLDENEPYYKERYCIAAKQSNAFAYEASFFFLIESQSGIADAKAFADSGE